MSPIEIAPSCAPGMPGISNIGMPLPEDWVSISISLSLSSPARSFLRKESRVAGLEPGPTSASSTRSSAASWARACTSLRLRSLVCAIATSTRSRMICSTSRPTYPTSVNLVASTLMKGAPASFASRRAISVLPTPVGPIIRIFFGSTSSRSEPVSCSLRQRFRSAMETARLASAWPTMKRSSSETISRGGKSVMSPKVGWNVEQASGLDDRRARLPVPDRLGRMDQHDDVQSQIVADMQPDQDLKQNRECDRRRNWKLSREQEAHDHRQVVGNRINDAVAVIIQRHRAGAIALDDPG